LIPVGFGYGDGDEFFMRGWVWDSETRPRPVAIPSWTLFFVIFFLIFLDNTGGSKLVNVHFF